MLLKNHAIYIHPSEIGTYPIEINCGNFKPIVIFFRPSAKFMICASLKYVMLNMFSYLEHVQQKLLNNGVVLIADILKPESICTKSIKL